MRIVQTEARAMGNAYAVRYPNIGSYVSNFLVVICDEGVSMIQKALRKKRIRVYTIEKISDIEANSNLRRYEIKEG